MEYAAESYCFNSDGCNMFYQFGVARYMQKSRMYSNKAVFTGYNSGLLVAIVLASNIPIGTLKKETPQNTLVRTFMKYFNQDKKENIRFNIFKEDDMHLIEKVLNSLLDAYPDAYKNIKKNLAIPVQCINGLNLWVTEFKTNKSILDAFKASTMCSLLNIKHMVIDKVPVTIGGLKSFQLLHPLTIIITCRDNLQGDKFVKYVNIDSIALLKPDVSPQTKMSYYIPSCDTIMYKLYYSGATAARTYFLNN